MHGSGEHKNYGLATHAPADPELISADDGYGPEHAARRTELLGEDQAGDRMPDPDPESIAAWERAMTSAAAAVALLPDPIRMALTFDDAAPVARCLLAGCGWRGRADTILVAVTAWAAHLVVAHPERLPRSQP